MAKPTTIRVPEDLLNEIDRLVREKRLDRATYLREVLRKGLRVDKQERLLKEYSDGELTLMETSRELGCNPWEILPLMKATHTPLNVGLEDWLDAAEIE
jgi:metal-responsive CopG/Arc/MetJ family transcriptional regulator